MTAASLHDICRIAALPANVWRLDLWGGPVLIDAGPAWGAGRRVRRAGSIRHLLLTHGHWDHAGGAARIAWETGATVWASAADAALLRRGLWHRPMRAAPSWLGQMATPLAVHTMPRRIPPVPDVHDLEDGPPAGVTVHPMPGHSAGQVALTLELGDGRRLLIAGDTVMTAWGLREPLAYEDRAAGLRSIGALADLAANADLLLPGHGPAVALTPAVVAALRGLAEGTGLDDRTRAAEVPLPAANTDGER